MFIVYKLFTALTVQTTYNRQIKTRKKISKAVSVQVYSPHLENQFVAQAHGSAVYFHIRHCSVTHPRGTITECNSYFSLHCNEVLCVSGSEGCTEEFIYFLSFIMK